MNDRQKNILAYIILGTLYSYALTLQIMTGTVLPFTQSGLFLTCLFFTLTFAVLFYNGTTMLVLQISLMLLFLMVFPGVRDYAPNGKGFLHDVLAKILDIYWYVRGYLPYDESYRAPLTTLCCFIITFAAAIGLYAVFSFFMLAAVGFSVFITGWLSGFTASGPAFYLYLVCFLALLAKRLNTLGTPADPDVKPSRRIPVSALYALPFAAVVAVTAALLPNPGTHTAEPIMLLRRQIENLSEHVYLWFNPAHFSFQSTGFTGKAGRLGGKVMPNDRFVMHVRADERLYLAGAYYDEYTGETWRNTGDPPAIRDEYFTDYTETVARLYGIQRIGGLFFVMNPKFKGNNDLKHEVTIDIGPSRTSTIFQPPKAFEIVWNGPDLAVLADGNNALETDGVMLRNTSYTARYVSLSVVDEDYLELVLQNSGKNFSMALSLATPDTLDVGYYTSRDNDELARYLALPETLPDRVRTLANELTVGEANEYAKAKAIEAYLLKIPYTLSPADVPRDRDFVDYFLYDGKEGYCTYYASALAVLCRAVGIPSRYVEGYVLPPKPDDSGYYTVTNSNAHAWTEIYIEGYGWAQLEATAPYHYAGASTRETGSPVFSESMVNDPYYYEHMNRLGLPEDRRRPAEDNAAPTIIDTGPSFSPGFLVCFRICVTIVVVFAFYEAVIGLYLLYRRFDHWHITQLSNNQQAEIYFARLQKMADYRYVYIRRGNETPAAYARRLGRRFAFCNERLAFVDVIDAVYRLRYSGRPLSDADLAVIRDGYFEMWAQLCAVRPRFVIVRDTWLGRI